MASSIRRAIDCFSSADNLCNTRFVERSRREETPLTLVRSMIVAGDSRSSLTLASMAYCVGLITRRTYSWPVSFCVSKEKCCSVKMLMIFRIKWSISSTALITFARTTEEEDRADRRGKNAIYESVSWYFALLARICRLRTIILGDMTNSGIDEL